MKKYLNVVLFWALRIGLMIWVGVDCYSSTQSPVNFGGPAWMWAIVASSSLFIALCWGPARTNEQIKTADARGTPYIVFRQATAGIGLKDGSKQMIQEVVRSGMRNYQTRYQLPKAKHVLIMVLCAAIFVVAHGGLQAFFGGHSQSNRTVLFALFIAFVLSRGRNDRAARMATVYLKYHHCPACAYSLAELPVAEDGCTLCPECHHAWRLVSST